MIGQRDIRRFGSAVAGTAAVAAVNFLASLLLLRSGDAEAFGVFAFMQIAVALGYGISNAVFGAPLVLVVQDSGLDRLSIERSFALANVVLCIAGAVVLALAAVLLDVPTALALLFGAHGLIHWLRWYQRSYGNAIQRNVSVSKSDLLYGVVAGTGLVGLLFLGRVSTATILGVQIVAALAAWLSSEASLRFVGVRGAGAGQLSAFGSQFKQHGRHALVGVLTTEGTSNGHAYIVTSLLGPAAFAPIAVALLMFRPVALVITALTQVERPRLAQALLEGRAGSVIQLMKLFGLVVLGCWAGNVLLAGVFLPMVERFKGADYQPGAVRVAALLCGLVFLLRCLRAPASAYMQANGAFRPLARATIVSSVVTIPLVSLLCSRASAEWSLLGTLAGELVAIVAIGAFAAQALRSGHKGAPA